MRYSMPASGYHPASGDPPGGPSTSPGFEARAAYDVGTPPQWLHEAHEDLLDGLVRYMVVILVASLLVIIPPIGWWGNAVGYLIVLGVFGAALLLRRSGRAHELTVYLVSMSLGVGILASLVVSVVVDDG